MKKILILFLLGFILFSQKSLAQGIEVSVFPQTIRIMAESTEVMEVTITNKLNQGSTFLISIFPTSLTGIIIVPEKNSVYLSPGETKTVKISLIASSDVLDKVPQSLGITVSSIDFPASSSNNVVIISERRVSVAISSLIIDKTILEPNDIVTISVGITNYALAPSEEYYLKTFVSKDNKVIKIYDDFIKSIPSRSTKIYNYSYFFEKYATPGKYVVYSELRDKLNKVVSSITAKEITLKEISDKIIVEKSSSYGILYSTILVKIRNEGNVLVENFNYTESLPSFATSFFDPELEPTYTLPIGDRVIYKWQISLSPGEEILIKYNFRVWNLWAGLLGIIIIVYLFYKFTFTPAIKKYHTHKGPILKGKEILITLEVKNNSLKEIKDIVIRDFVPRTAKVIEKFDTLRPSMKITSRGTELIWKLASLKPREERILTYRIEPIADIVGKIHLPPATLKYVKGKEINEKMSKSLLLQKK